MDIGINTYAEIGIDFGRNLKIVNNILAIEADEYSHDQDGAGLLYITTGKVDGMKVWTAQSGDLDN